MAPALNDHGPAAWLALIPNDEGTTMSDINTPKSPNGWHVIAPAVQRLHIGQRGTNNSLIAVEFDADQLLADLGAAAAKEEIRTQLAEKLRDSPKIARFAQLRDNLAAADRGIEEAKLQRDQAELDRRSFLMTPLTPDRVEQVSGISRRWHEADGALASWSAAKQALAKELEAARKAAEHALHHELQTIAGRMMGQFHDAIPPLAQAIAEAAGPHLDRLATVLQGRHFAALPIQFLAGEFDDVLAEIQSTVAPSALDAAAAEPEPPPTEIRRKVPAAVLAGGMPSISVRLHEHLVEQVEFVNEPVQPASAEPAEPTEPTSATPAEASSEPASVEADPRPRRRGK
jgi:hypothetical protein